MMSRVIKEDIEGIVGEFESNLKELSGKKVLITGGNGFIPSYIVDCLVRVNKDLKKPCKIVVVNKHTVNEKSRLSHLINDSNVSFITQDVGKPFKVPRGLDVILHAASRANPASFLEDPVDTIDANVNGTRTLLEYCKKNPVDNFLLFSSGEVYGNPPKEFVPTSENFYGNVNCANARACYSESKRFAETLCAIFNEKHGVPAKILRIFHTYGPGLRDDGKVITDFFKMGKNKRIIQIKDRGEARIAFCYVSDLSREIFKTMFEGNSGEVYNLGNNSEIVSIKELAEIISEVLGNKSIVKINSDAKEAYVRVRCPDISKIRALGFSPRFSLREGLTRMKEHYDENGI